MVCWAASVFLCHDVVISRDVRSALTLQGLGYYALEEHRFGANGHLETIGAGRYRIPTVSSVPLQMNVTLLKDCGNPKAVYSSKVMHCSVEYTSEITVISSHCERHLYIVE